LHFEYLLEETTVCEVVRGCCDSIWNCLKKTGMPEKTEDDWMNIANDFDQRAQFPNTALWLENTFEYKCQLEVDLCFIMTNTFSQLYSWL
jgi:hypothetical protein